MKSLKEQVEELEKRGIKIGSLIKLIDVNRDKDLFTIELCKLLYQVNEALITAKQAEREKMIVKIIEGKKVGGTCKEWVAYDQALTDAVKAITNINKDHE